MMSSTRFGGSVTGARPRVQIGPAAGAKAGAIVPAEQQMGMGGEGQLFPNHRTDVHGGGPIGKKIEVGVVHRVRIGAEDRSTHRHVNLAEHLGQAAAALAADHTMEITPPEVLALTGGLKLTLHYHRSRQVQPQPVEGRIVGLELAVGPNGTALKVPDIHAQHSPLS
jgi:hypothetical protein